MGDSTVWQAWGFGRKHDRRILVSGARRAGLILFGPGFSTSALGHDLVSKQFVRAENRALLCCRSTQDPLDAFEARAAVCVAVDGKRCRASRTRSSTCRLFGKLARGSASRGRLFGLHAASRLLRGRGLATWRPIGVEISRLLRGLAETKAATSISWSAIPYPLRGSSLEVILESAQAPTVARTRSLLLQRLDHGRPNKLENCTTRRSRGGRLPRRKSCYRAESDEPRAMLASRNLGRPDSRSIESSPFTGHVLRTTGYRSQGRD